MKRILALAACLQLAACQSTTGAETASKVLGNLEHCERVYIASVGGLGIPGGSLNIRCPARPFDEAAS